MPRRVTGSGHTVNFRLRLAIAHPHFKHLFETGILLMQA